MKFGLTIVGFLLSLPFCTAQQFAGKVSDAETGAPLENVEVRIGENGATVTTNDQGVFVIHGTDDTENILSFNLEGYMFQEYRNIGSQSDMKVALRKKIKSAASKRWDIYMSDDCKSYKSVEIPENPEWAVEFKETELKGDLAPDANFVRRDPSAVIKVGDLYYVWYTKGLAEPSTWFKPGRDYERSFPWDLCDVWYATSKDGWEWDEKGMAVGRGEAGTFDDRSVFTPEIFVADGKYYLVYQVVQAPYVARVKNNVAMAVADSPDGPWTKMPEPVLRPTNNGIWEPGTTDHHAAIKKGDFDSHKVHDPCVIPYKGKYYMYYKGERMGEEKFCDQREIKWGVAIADKPEGPYVKSEYNPITNTGHEVIVWPYKEGIAIIQKLDGPEMGSVQYAVDGVNFEIMSTAKHVPDAFGVYRPDDPNSSPTAGITWGLCHTLMWGNVEGGWNYLRRFDIKK